MIGRISGILLEKNPPQIVVTAGGLGYEIDVPMSTLYQLPELGQPVTLFTHLVVREDAHLLYGFASLDERVAFRQLVKISGVGAKLALAVLSGMETGELAQVIARQDVARLVRIPGIGRKTAERLLLELRGKMQDTASMVASHVVRNAVDEVVEALLALGYNEREAGAAVRGLVAGVAVEDGIRAALKWLAQA